MSARRQHTPGTIASMTPDEDDVHGIYAPVRTANAFEQTVERLGRAIRMGLLAPGEQLPSERELATRLALSRSTVREALRVLQEAGYLEARRGRGGGTFVADHLPSEPERPPQQVVHDYGSGDLAALLRFRRVLELGAAEIAAERAVPEQIDRLADLVDEMSALAKTDYRAYRGVDARFHIELAAIADAPALLDALGGVQADLSEVLIAIPHSIESLTNADVQHRRIVAALEARDRDAARVAMREHVEGIERLLTVLIPKGAV